MKEYFSNQHLFTLKKPNFALKKKLKLKDRIVIFDKPILIKM